MKLPYKAGEQMVYKLTWIPLSPFQTALHSDTIFGHLCWAIKYIYGKDKLDTFLVGMEKPVLTLSSAFPAGMYPAPKTNNWIETSNNKPDLTLAEQIERRRAAKIARKISFISFQELSNLLCNKDSGIDYAGKVNSANEIKVELAMHNSVNRISSTTKKGTGSLFAQPISYTPKGTVFESYLTTDYFSLEELTEIFSSIELSGFGKNKHTGQGRFKIEICEGSLPTCETPNAWLLLSNMVPATDDPINGYYECFMKFGKLGGSFAAGRQNPFKKPLLMLKPGSVFLGNKAPKGCLVRDIHPDYADICQYAYAYSVGIEIKGELHGC